MSDELLVRSISCAQHHITFCDAAQDELDGSMAPDIHFLAPHDVRSAAAAQL